MEYLQWLCLFTVYTLSWPGGAAFLDCKTNPGVGQDVLSLDTMLLPTQNIIATRNFYGSFPGDDIINFGPERTNVWCASPSPETPHVNLTFTEAVVVTGLLTGGYDGGSIDYVTNFTIHYSYLGQATNETMSFFAPGQIAYFSLDEPFVSDMITLSVEGSFGDICWSVAIFGCRLSAATETPPTFATPTFATPTPCAQQTTEDYMVLAIVVPTAVVVVTIVAIIVTLGVCISLRVRHKQNPTDSIRYSRKQGQAEAVRMINEIEDDNQAGSEDRNSSTTITEIPNILYTIPNPESENQEYETIGSRLEESTVVSNPNYSVPFQDQHEGDGIKMTKNECYISSSAAGSHRESRHQYDSIPQ